jgi:hypothetical protein
MAKSKRSPQAQEAREKLIILSAEIKYQAAVIAAMTGQMMSVNQGLIFHYEIKTGCKDFRTFHQWKEAGYKVKKGAESFRVWGSPIKATSKTELVEGDEPAEDKYKYWPMCCLFNESQVEPFDREPAPDVVDQEDAGIMVETAAMPTDEQAGTQEESHQTEPMEQAQSLLTNESEPNPFVFQDYATRQDDRKLGFELQAQKASRESQATYNRAKSMASVIPFGQPILVGHHSERRDRNYRAKIHNTYGKAFVLDDKARYYEGRAASVGHSGIASDDPEAISKLQDKLRGLVDNQERMKAINKALRSDDDQALVQLGLSDIDIEEVKKPDFLGRVGFPDYALSNNNAEIRRIKKRIEDLTHLRQRKPVSFENEEFKVYVEDGRVLVHCFQGKPNEVARKFIKERCFKWSPHRSAWSRKVTANSLADSRYLIERLKGLDSIY